MSLSGDYRDHKTILAPLKSNYEIDLISHDKQSIILQYPI